MDLILVVLGIYLGIGLLYALYILLFGYDKWYLFLLNVVFGPPVLLHVVIKTIKGEKIAV